MDITHDDIVRLDQNARRSRAVAAAGMLFLAGQVADDTTLDIAGQTRQVLAKIDALLAAAGTERSRLLTAQVWIADLADLDAMNRVWDEWVVPGHTPTRCCGEVRLTAPGYRVEIVVSALLR